MIVDTRKEYIVLKMINMRAGLSIVGDTIRMLCSLHGYRDANESEKFVFIMVLKPSFQIEGI